MDIIILCKFLPVEGPPYLCMIVKELKIECPFNLIPEDAPVLSVLLLPTRNHYFEIPDWFLAKRKLIKFRSVPVSVSLFKVSNENTRTICQSTQRQWHRFDVFIINIEKISPKFSWGFYCWLRTSKCQLRYLRAQAINQLLFSQKHSTIYFW